jgi:hypothetical protein
MLVGMYLATGAGSSLACAASHGNIYMMQLLINTGGGNVHLRSAFNGSSAMHAAAAANHVDSLEWHVATFFGSSSRLCSVAGLQVSLPRLPLCLCFFFRNRLCLKKGSTARIAMFVKGRTILATIVEE